MLDAPVGLARIGYTRYEFNRIFCIYSRNVYAGLFRDFTFADLDGRYFISFRAHAADTPLVTVEKRRLPGDRALFVATTPGPAGTLKTLARSEKIDNFVDALEDAIHTLSTTRAKSLRVV